MTLRELDHRADALGFEAQRFRAKAPRIVNHFLHGEAVGARSHGFGDFEHGFVPLEDLNVRHAQVIRPGDYG